MYRSCRYLSFLVLIAVLSSPAHPQASSSPQRAPSGKDVLLDHIGRGNVPSGILYDLALPISGIERFDGAAGSPPLSLQLWKQIYHELYNSSIDIPKMPGLPVLVSGAEMSGRRGRIPVGIIDMDYDRLRPGVKEKLREMTEAAGREAETVSPCVEATVFAAAPLVARTFRGREVTFVTGGDWYISRRPEGDMPISIEFDPGDGRGFRAVRSGGEVTAYYDSEGIKTCVLRAVMPGGETKTSSSRFEVAALAAPSPDDTLFVTASIPYEGGYASGEAYVYLADPLSPVSDPIVVIEGFDLSNEMYWDELYALLNQEELVERIRAMGYDLVVLNFLDSTDYIQRNSFVVVELLQQVQSMIPSSTDLALIGASMGGLCGRYALSYMESNDIGHRVRTFVSFDSPQRGANIPLGVQYWVKFFSGQSEAAADMLTGLESPSARQMLVYHFTDPPGSTGDSDPLRAALLGEFSSFGGYPSQPRNIAVANGSGHGSGQPYSPGDQVVLYEYQSVLVDIVGNVWAVPDDTYSIIFDGLLDMFWPLPDDAMTVYAGGTDPYDNAPGGSRGSMADMDSTEAPFGDIIALHERHCFIPTISALDIATDDLFYDVAADPYVMALTPFDTVYWAPVNEE
ncbi:MAG TPA: hypothetical protein VLA34_14175, partial [Candidatus Krumholzibacterium sp.]|nr:hypothetical protein [Candidatus Krumholzibacterium sp.]